jgi:translation elongation factor EF-Ts
MEEFVARQLADAENVELESSPDEKEPKSDDETRLLFQEYLEDQTLLVGDVLVENGVLITDFERFECGEDSQ